MVNDLTGTKFKVSSSCESTLSHNKIYTIGKAVRKKLIDVDSEMVIEILDESGKRVQVRDINNPSDNISRNKWIKQMSKGEITQKQINW